MAGETILVIDAGQDIDQRMTTTLEAENYLIFSIPPARSPLPKIHL
jgi:hypothetical protein